MSTGTQRQVLLVGASGMLGGAIMKAVLERAGLALRVLMRPGKPGVSAVLRAAGVESTEGDVMDPSSLATAVEGIDVVVSGHTHTPQTNPKVVNGAIVVHAGYEAQYVGRLELQIDPKTKKI